MYIILSQRKPPFSYPIIFDSFSVVFFFAFLPSLYLTYRMPLSVLLFGLLSSFLYLSSLIISLCWGFRILFWLPPFPSFVLLVSDFFTSLPLPSSCFDQISSSPLWISSPPRVPLFFETRFHTSRRHSFWLLLFNSYRLNGFVLILYHLP